MRILFDNGTPRPLRRHLFRHEVETAQQRGWETLSNGALLDEAQIAGFEIIITTDQNIRHQQNMSNRRVAVVVLMQTAWPLIQRRTEDVRRALEDIQPGEIREVAIPGEREQ